MPRYAFIPIYLKCIQNVMISRKKPNCLAKAMMGKTVDQLASFSLYMPYLISASVNSLLCTSKTSLVRFCTRVPPEPGGCRIVPPSPSEE